MRTVGLVLGKFAPLHRGHQRLIETSLAETDHTIVLMYDSPEHNVPPLPIRRRWIEDLYPTVEVLEAWDGPTETGLDPVVTARHDAYLKNRLSRKNVTHFFSSEPYGEHVSRALGAMDRRVDETREVIPISATAIRNDLFKNRQYVSPRVYRDLITHVVFLGAPSTGKTTLAQALAAKLETVWMPEYGREYWNEHQVNRRLTREQLVEIAVGHREREDRLLESANGVFLIDTDATTTLQFSYYYHESAHPELVRLADACRDRYDLVFLCECDIPYDDTWDRSGAVFRTTMQRRIESDLRARKRPYVRLTGSVEERCAAVLSKLADFRK
ncbi:MAG: AAA family ATPase [Pirellula sp.]|jgi:NadR type nicotinamide-nucleotide adenylyltransferase|nr:AAA family ATPase [Pirellula sp.]